MNHKFLRHLSIALVCLLGTLDWVAAGTKTWDGKHATEDIEVTVVYFVPSDRRPLPDWRERIDYYCRRIELFHAREFQGQSKLTTIVDAEPLVSRLTTEQLRRGDANAIFYRTLEEADERLEFAAGEPKAFPILLVLSDINWRPLDDFYRLRPEDGRLVFEGNYNGGEHFPGATSGGARATYLGNRRKGWGLVSADGWRVPYRGSDCVIYHEGCGHTVGLPHPEPGNGSVMSLGQYQGWLSESWLDKEQKIRLGWVPREADADPQLDLFSRFRALAQPTIPRPGQTVALALRWPDGVKVKELRLRYQTAIDGPWIDAKPHWEGDAPEAVVLGTFDRATPVSYRIEAELDSGVTAELWGYFQVRNDPRQSPQPLALSPDLIERKPASPSKTEVDTLPKEEIDLLVMIDPKNCWQQGEWSEEKGKLLSPKRYGARLELPYSPPAEYRLNVIVESLDEPNGLLLGLLSGGKRFVTLFNYASGEVRLSAIENVRGRNVGNETTFAGPLLRKDRLAQVIVTVTKAGIHAAVDGRTILSWEGSPDELSLSDYWSTPNEKALFLGAYDCRYRFHRITLEPISGAGSVIESRQ
jgi:hypothetical protein